MTRQARPWLVAGACLGLLALGVGIWAAGDRWPSPGAPGPDAGPWTPHVLVLNGAGRSGLAREISLLLGPAGIVAAGVGNAPDAYGAESVLVNRRLADEEAARLAVRLGGLPVLREWDGRAAEDAVLVLGSDWELVRDALAGAGRPRTTAAN